jgi:hypothetical protein
MGSIMDKLLGFDPPPKAKPLPAPVEQVDVSGTKDYLKMRAKTRKGRASTVLSKLGNMNTGNKTVLG